MVNGNSARLSSAMVFLSLAIAPAALAQKVYDPGATDTEIKIGNITPYTGWAKNTAQSRAPKPPTSR